MDLFGNSYWSQWLFDVLGLVALILIVVVVTPRR